MEKREKSEDIKKNILGRYSLITMTGNSEVIIEGLRGILDYDCDSFRANTISGIVAITGSALSIEGLTAEEVCLKGRIVSVEFI